MEGARTLLGEADNGQKCQRFKKNEAAILSPFLSFRLAEKLVGVRVKGRKLK